MTQLSIIVPVFNKYSFTKACLIDLFKLSANNEIIIIDNASSDETQAELSQIKKDNFVYIRNSENIFHSKACNQGFRLARGEAILFLNNDIRVKSNHSNWTAKVVEACNSTGGLVGTTMGQLDDYFNFIKEDTKQLSGNTYLSGWCIAGSRKVWDNLDLDGTGQVWDEDLIFYFNDTDIGFRCRKNNIPQTVIPLSELVHFGQISAKQINVSQLYMQGRQIFLQKWSK